ncbi:hypothetical protein [Variovorax gossypii]
MTQISLKPPPSTRDIPYVGLWRHTLPNTAAIVKPQSPRAKTGRPPFAIETMLRIHYLQQQAPSPDLQAGALQIAPASAR